MKSGIRVHGRDLFHKADNIWFTCCALHNWLLDVDGLGAQWTEGVQGDWEGSWGLHDSSDAARFGVSQQPSSVSSGGAIPGGIAQQASSALPPRPSISSGIGSPGGKGKTMTEEATYSSSSEQTVSS